MKSASSDLVKQLLGPTSEFLDRLASRCYVKSAVPPGVATGARGLQDYCFECDTKTVPTGVPTP